MYALQAATTQRAPRPKFSNTALGAIGTVSLFERNNTIFAEGDDADRAYKVVSGGVRLCKMMPDGRRQIAAFALPGDYFGFDWLGHHALTAEALNDTTAISYARNRLERLGDEDHDVRAELYATLRHDLWAAQNHLIILGRQSARERVTSFLVELIERRKGDNLSTIAVPMTRRDMADYLGLTVETICRELSALKREGVIAIPGRHAVIVHDEAALRRASMADD
ncbi:MAG: helix-turn-helix domain-containing protein [Alphaproteobacteria bacterium]|nr:helix-turn-helix domain-containing protein [Alphaproteobacteria bacterium]MBL6937723.1 helix-turn-helix domain-containing protein [Alphaproteobacteria bacterium]MBL7099061.1 helix-turn-helix domain-containing protein [Alphaproteobacteria bacterium]